MDALHARKDLQKILDMFKQLEPALEFDDGKIMNKSISRNNKDHVSNTSGTMDSNLPSNTKLIGGEHNLSDHLDLGSKDGHRGR
jgi:hypothetical protein